MLPTALKTVGRCWPLERPPRAWGHKRAFSDRHGDALAFHSAPMVGETAIHLHAPCFAGSEPHNEESSGASVRFFPAPLKTSVEVVG